MADIIYRRTGVADPDGFVPGEIRIGSKTWKTIEKKGAPWVRKGEYKLEMGYKKQGGVKNRESLRFKGDSPAIETFMIHDYRGDIAGCIAPVVGVDKGAVKGSQTAMKEVMAALGTFTEGRTVTIDVQTNIADGVKINTKEKWIKSREEEAAAKAKR